MNYQLPAVILAGLLALTPMGLLQANEGMEYEAYGKGHKMDAKTMQKELGLTDDQVAKINAAKAADKEAMKALWDKQRDLMKKLEDQVKNKASDADIQATLDELKSNRMALRDQEDQLHSQKETILTPIQRAKLILKHHRRMGEGKGRAMRKMHKEPA